MRLARQFLRSLSKQTLIDRSSKCCLGQVRYRSQATKATTTKIEERKKEECLKPCNPPYCKRPTLFSRIFGGGKQSKEKPPNPKEVCKTIDHVPPEQAEREMRKIAEETGGEVYRTCGTAYVLQQDMVSGEEPEPSAEELILDEMTKHPSLKGQCDPLPPFQSVETRWLLLSEKKLHPLYKKMMSVPKPSKPAVNLSSGQVMDAPAPPMYKTRSGPVTPDEFPPHLKINKEMFDKKNLICEFKRVEPPQQLLARIVEMKKNERPQLKKSQPGQQQKEETAREEKRKK